MKKWTEKEIVFQVASMFGWRKFTVVPNVRELFGHRAEVDLVVLDNKTRYAREVEIKISRADFLADKKKDYKHDSPLFKYFYFALPKELYPEVVDLIPEEAGVILVREIVDYDGTTWRVAEVKVEPKAKAVFRQWDDSEALRLAQLGTLRFWYREQKERQKEKETERQAAGK